MKGRFRLVGFPSYVSSSVYWVLILCGLLCAQSEEDLALKQQLELYVERVQDPDPGLRKVALESMRFAFLFIIQLEHKFLLQVSYTACGGLQL